MRSPSRSHPHQMPAGPLPIRVRPVHGERTGSYLIRLATANRCPTRTILQLIGRVHHRSRPDQWVEVDPHSMISMNTAALHRLSAYCGVAAAHLVRALPELGHEHTEHQEPILRVGPTKRTFLRSCPACEQCTRGAVLAPDRQPLQLMCPRHDTWLVKADPPLNTDLVPEVQRAMNLLRRQQRRHTNDAITTLYADVREHLTFGWRGLRWHSQLAKRWTARQQILRPEADQKDLFVLARTEHWSMLPEAAAIIGVLAKSRQPGIIQAIDHQHPLDESLSRALHLSDR